MFSTKGSFNPMKIIDRKSSHVNNAILFLQRKSNLRPQLTEIHTDGNGNIIESYNFLEDKIIISARSIKDDED